MYPEETTASAIGRRRGAGKKNPPKLSIILSVALLSAVAIIGLYLTYKASSPVMGGITTLSGNGNVSLLKQSKMAGYNRKRRYNHGTNSQSSKKMESKADEWEPILRAEMHLIDLSLSKLIPSGNDKGYQGVIAKFCRIDWNLHKNDPPSYPMFRFLVSASGCEERSSVISVDMATLVEKAREYDKVMEKNAKSQILDDIEGYVHVMSPAGFVFHESRVGSTLVANALAAMDPKGHRIFSESSPINEALRACEGLDSDCDNEMYIRLFRDVVYLMSRTNSPEEKRIFFKVSSIGTKRIGIMQEAFPNTPWIFIYRNPTQTMMSHLDPSKIGTISRGIQAVCTRARKYPPEDLRLLVSETGRDISDLSDVEFCAAHLASLCESALREMRRSSMGRAVEYDGIVEKLIETVIPNHFHVEMTDDARHKILDVSKMYSKKGNSNREWKKDSEEKENKATREILEASDFFLSKSYNELNLFGM